MYKRSVSVEASPCVDGLDNDGDGWFDAEDPDCASIFDEVGYATEGYACNDGIDNNNNGMIDSLIMVVFLHMIQMKF